MLKSIWGLSLYTCIHSKKKLRSMSPGPPVTVPHLHTRASRTAPAAAPGAVGPDPSEDPAGSN